MSRFLSQKYRDINAYVPGEQPQDMQYVKLNTNESPYPPSQLVLDSIEKSELSLLRLYSDPECSRLRTAIAGLYGVEKENVIVSNGSDDILNFAFTAFSGCGVKAAFADITYGFYETLAGLHGLDTVRIPLKSDFTICVEDYIGLNEFIAIANPNAPTGIALSRGDVEKIVASNPDNVVLIDEAYVDFGGESCVELTKKYSNLLVVMTYSKSRSLAGARLGFAIGNRELIADLNKIRYSTNPYSVNRLSLVCGEAAIKSQSYYTDLCEKICKTRAFTVDELKKRGFDVLPSCANFVFAKSNSVSGEKLYLELKKRGVLVRHFSSERICDYNRITIGTDEQMRTFLSKTDEVLSLG